MAEKAADALVEKQQLKLVREDLREIRQALFQAGGIELERKLDRILGEYQDAYVALEKTYTDLGKRLQDSRRNFDESIARLEESNRRLSEKISAVQDDFEKLCKKVAAFDAETDESVRVLKRRLGYRDPDM